MAAIGRKSRRLITGTPKHFILLEISGSDRHVIGSRSKRAELMEDIEPTFKGIFFTLQLGDVAKARELFDGFTHLHGAENDESLDLGRMLHLAEGVEQKHGRGALLDLAHPVVCYFIDEKVYGPEKVEAAERFIGTELAVADLEDFVPGLSRHEHSGKPGPTLKIS